MNAGLSSGQQQALGNAWLGAQGSGAQQNALNSVLGGAYNVNAQYNPYAGSGNLDQVIAQSNKDTTTAYNQSAVPQLAAQFAQGGAFGGSAMAQAQQQS